MIKKRSTIVDDFTSRDPEEVCNERLRNYVNAIEYCQANNLNKDGIQDILKRAERIKNIQDQLKSGDKSAITYMPADITPEDIYGEPAEKRNNKYVVMVKTVGESILKLRDIGMENG